MNITLFTEIVRVQGVRLASDGSGVGFVEGVATFVPELLPGEIAEIQITERKKRFQRAALVRLLQPAVERQEPPCPVFAVCGGCQLQHLDYASTLAWKRQWVSDALQRLGKVDVEQGMNQTLGMEFPWRYRNKAHLHRDEEGRLGYYRERTHETVRFPDCLLLSEGMNQWIKTLEDTLGQNYPTIRNVTLRQNTRGEGLCLLENLPEGRVREHLRTRLQTVFSESMSVWGLTQSGNLVSLTGGEGPAVGIRDGLLTGLRDTRAIELEVEILGKRFQVSPLAFLQVNPLMTEKLYSLALEWTDLTGKERVWDLYSGIGTLTLALASKAQEVLGIEENPFAVEDALRNALLNGLKNAHFLAGRVEDRLMELKDRPDVVVLDPPRAGIELAVVHALLRLKPERIIYVSCDPGTLARDAGRLVQGGYRVERVQPVDMFPWTRHVESIIMMTYSGQKGK
ncbi:MAG: 23S rRNA (uracil(1939)-C(5))-methyltransferase RlmD [Desulfitobacteriaceae bacterium]|nr:23S rRNA (uracil(1939)-C(5))-methyltransferase RlmD [Desulfitobacteriaceae bacterium]MDI6912681.1 23S rRNA (uracil(1939)-C(5))-methyltransferase RlmD [Desulfitobacteriaceae bacterium]